MDISQLTPEMAGQLLTLLQQQGGAGKNGRRGPRQPARMTVFEKSTGEMKELYRIDALEGLNLGVYVNTLAECEIRNPETEAKLQESALTPEQQYAQMEAEQLRELWKELHPGETLHPQVGKQRLITEILAKQPKGEGAQE